MTATTRGDELLAAFDELAAKTGAGDRDFLTGVLARSGWANRPVSAPLLPSGVRHGVPWALSVSLRDGEVEPRVWLEAQCDPPSAGGYLAQARRMLPTFDIDAQRWWHQISFGRRTRVHAYACIPDRAPAVPRGFVTMVSRDHDGTNRKSYTLIPASRPCELVDDPGLAAIVHPSDAPIGWLVSDAEDGERTLHFAAHVHGDPGLADRLASTLGPRYAAIARGQRLHFVAWSKTKTNIYFLPTVSVT